MEANTCSICKLSYNSSTKKPLVLPCSHFFCQDCLQKGEARKEQKCLVCCKTWSGVRVADLSSRYQLTPVEGQTEKDEVQKEDSEVTSHDDMCDEHNDKIIFWCESCDVPTCSKCFMLKHKSCDFVLIADKQKSRKHEAETSLLKEKLVKFSTESEVINEKICSIKSMIRKSQSLVQEMADHNANLAAWKNLANKILLPNRFRSLNKTTQPQSINWSSLEELEKKIGTPPSSLLVHVAETYQSTNEDDSTFISILHDCVGANVPDEKPTPVKGDEPSVEKVVETLTEGGEWVVSNATSAAAVKSVIQATSRRPKKMIVNWKNMPKNKLSDLQTFIYPGKSYAVEAVEIMDCFPHSLVPCAETRSCTRSRLDAWITPGNWAALTQFQGHLDSTAITKLPKTIKNVGLMLREQWDMRAVNMLCGAAFGREYEFIGRDRLKWTSWTGLDLSIAKTFKAEDWELNWKFETEKKNLEIRHHCPNTETVSLSEALSTFRVRLSLYLPQMSSSDRHWMGKLFRVLQLEEFSGRLPLFLNGARIGLDTLLGVLRDSGHRWEVHLPASLTHEEQREAVAKQYEAFGHSITWDLE